MNESTQASSIGYKRALERHPELVGSIGEFERWLHGASDWLQWIENNIPDNIHASRAEVMESFYVTPLGLELLERLNLDIYPEGREEITRVEYDVKKLLRALVALPTIARLRNKKLVRRNQTINTTFKEIIDDTLNGRADLNAISGRGEPSQDNHEATE